MKKLKLVFLGILLTVWVLLMTDPHSAQAVSTNTSSGIPPASPSSTFIDNLKKIQNLKEKIATKVAEIRQKEKAGLYGIIKKIDNISVTLATKNQDRSVTLPEDTIYFSLTDGTKKESSFKNLKEGNAITILGYYDEGKTVLSSKYIFLEKPKSHLTGKIADIDKTNYTLTLKDPQGSTVVDIENYTKMVNFSREKGIQKIGFSKLKIGDNIHLIATPNAKDEKRAAALRIITLSFNPPQTPTPTLSKGTASPSATPKTKPTTQ